MVNELETQFFSTWQEPLHDSNIDVPLEKEVCLSKTRHISDTLYVLNGKWKLVLIFTLCQTPRRFNEILKEVEGITPKVLARELKDLENNGFITRSVVSRTPVNIIYQTTSYSDTLQHLLRELSDWGQQHREKIRESIRNNRKQMQGDDR